jgi:HPt (histidine-containing phosphotransfer) domain-containing protein
VDGDWQPVVVDEARMKDLSENLGSALADVIDTYLEDAPRMIADMEAACAAGDHETAREIAHSLKSSSGIFGAQRMVDLCRALEENANSGCRRALVEQVAGAYRRLQAVLHLYR